MKSKAAFALAAFLGVILWSSHAAASRPRALPMEGGWTRVDYPSFDYEFDSMIQEDYAWVVTSDAWWVYNGYLALRFDRKDLSMERISKIQLEYNEGPSASNLIIKV